MTENATHISHVFSTFAPGGPQVRIASIINALGDKYRHSIFAMDGDFQAICRLESKIDFEIIRIPQNLSRLAKARHVAAKLSMLNHAVLVTHNWGSMVAMLTRPVGRQLPWIHMETGFENDESRSQKRRRDLARMILLRRAARIVVPSKVLINIATNTWRVPINRLYHIENGVDLGRFTPGGNPQLRESLNIPTDALVIGTVANLRPVKDLVKLIDAFEKLGPESGIRLVLVGDGIMRHALEQTCENRNIKSRVHFVGSQIDVAGFHRMFDIFALSSKSEQSPVSLLEALASGKPIVSTDVGDISENVCRQNRRFVVAVDDDRRFAAALQEMSSDSSLRQAIGAENRAVACARFSHIKMVGRFQALYQEIANLDSELAE